MIALIVYADVLIFLNTLVDYFLLLAAAKLTGEKTKTWRTVLSAFLGGISSLYIFLPRQPTIVEIAYKTLVSFVLSVVCFKFRGFKRYLKNTGVLFLVSCAYAGVMFAFWMIFKPYGMVINNSVVYFNISPTVLILCSIGGYILFSLLWRIFKGSSRHAEKCNVTVVADSKSITLQAIVDTGNSIEDVFDKSEVIIADRGRVEALLGSTDFQTNPDLRRRYRILPCSTVSGYGTLEGFRCDSAVLEQDGKKTVLEKPLLAVSKVGLKDGYNAIINPKVLR